MLDPSFAETFAALAVGAASVFTIVPVAVVVAPFSERARVNVRFGVYTPSAVLGTVTVLEVCPGVNVSEPLVLV